MELLGERPVWSMSGSELLSTLDALDAEAARRESYRLKVIAAIENTGYAAELGARDAAELLQFRYRLDAPEARRTLRLAQALPRYPAVSAALDDTAAADPAAGIEDAPEDGAENGADNADAADGGTGGGWLLRPAQAAAIVSTLERVPAHVPIADRDAAERQLVKLAAHLSPSELRAAGIQIRDILDTDGPEPEEHQAYARESLTLTPADRGVKFRGYLANENAELLRAVIHTGARPHKTIDGEHDPRPRDKRQADALTAALTIAATTTDTTRQPTEPPAASPGSTADAASAASADTAAGTADATPGDAADGTAGGAADRVPGEAPADSEGAAPGRSTGAALVGRPGGAVVGDATDGAPDRVSGEAPAGSAGAAGGTAGAAPGGAAGGVAEAVPGFGAKAQITVTIDFQDLKAATANASGQLVYGDGLSAATVRRLACDARIIPLVLGTNSEPLDVGRSERLVTRAMRRALNARDQGCVVCGAPPIMCDAHHLTSWIDGGDTKVSNLVLLCRRHHVDLHNGQWSITITDGVVHVARPTWAEPSPNRHHRPNQRGTHHPTDSPQVTHTPTAPPREGQTVTPDPTAPATAPPRRASTVAANANPQATAPSGGGETVATDPTSPATSPPRESSRAAAGAGSQVTALPGGRRTIAAANSSATARSGGGRTVVAGPSSSAAAPSSPWPAGESAVASARGSKWKADEVTLQQATEFALIDAPAS